jgi:DNA-binding HxlR family transcriptional regulator
MDQRESTSKWRISGDFVVLAPPLRDGLASSSGSGMLRPVKTYGQFCPVAQALEILAERWTLLVIRELLTGSHRFGEIQRGVPLMSRTLLSQRLKTLQEQELVRRTERGGAPHYEVTEAGEALRDIVMRLGVWGRSYAKTGIPDHQLDPKLLMWDIHRRLNLSAFPAGRTIILFRFADAAAGQKRFWLHVEGDEVDVCYTPLGFDEDLTVDTDVRTLTEVWMGYIPLREALRSKRITLEGPPALRRGFASWLALNVFAETA